TPKADTATNGGNLGAGADTPPAGLSNEGYGAEARWNLTSLYQQGSMIPGHTYRFYVMVHDGDQNQSGGDAGQAAYTYYYPGPAVTTTPATLSGYVYADNNHNNVMDTGDTGLGGVTVTLTGTDS